MIQLSMNLACQIGVCDKYTLAGVTFFSVTSAIVPPTLTSAYPRFIQTLRCFNNRNLHVLI